jgi:hypothetical protein
MEKACEKHEIFKEILYLFTSVVLEGSTWTIAAKKIYLLHFVIDLGGGYILLNLVGGGNAIIPSSIVTSYSFDNE